MDQPQQPRGDFYAPVNRYKQAGDNKPIFTGTLTKPGDDAKLPFALWGFEYTDKSTGEVLRGYSGAINGVPANIPAEDQIAALLASEDKGVQVSVANLTLRPGQIVLFPNKFKDEAPEKGRPDLWGWVNPTDGTPPFRPAVWVQTYENSNRPYLSGATQYPLPGKSEPEMQDASVESLIAEGKVTRGTRRKKETVER